MVFYVQSPNPSFGCVNTLKGLAIVCFSIFHLCSNLVLLFFAADECWWRGRQWQTGVALVVGGREHQAYPASPRHLLDSQTSILGMWTSVGVYVYKEI